MKKNSIVGDLINFRGLVYSPINENGVIFLFGKVTNDLNMYIEEIKPGFPDCVARRFTGRGWERVAIEFEYKSRSFVDHKHNVNDCDLIVCWEHDWKDCPLEVIELSEEIKGLPNWPIERPDKTITKDRPTLEEHLKNYPKETAVLFEMLNQKVKKLSDEIWYKVAKYPGASFYSPERVFVFYNPRKPGFSLELFTGGEKLPGVKSLAVKTEKGGGEKWGRVNARSKSELEKIFPAVKRSFQLIKEAIKNNEPTGWRAKLEGEQEEETESSYAP